MSDYDAFLDLLLTPDKSLSLLEWAKRGWIKQVEQLTPYFIAYLYYPFDSAEKGTKEYSELKDKCDLLYRKIHKDCENGPFLVPRRSFTDHDWPFSLPDCPELAMMNTADRQGYLSNGTYPPNSKEILTYFIDRNDFREWLEEVGKSMKIVSEKSLLYSWLNPNKPFDIEPTQEPIEDNGKIQNSVYRLLLAMAIDAFAFDPTVKKQANGTMKQIVGALERQGLGSMDGDTVLKHLRTAVEKTGWKP